MVGEHPLNKKKNPYVGYTPHMMMIIILFVCLVEYVKTASTSIGRKTNRRHNNSIKFTINGATAPIPFPSRSKKSYM